MKKGLLQVIFVEHLSTVTMFVDAEVVVPIELLGIASASTYNAYWVLGAILMGPVVYVIYGIVDHVFLEAAEWTMRAEWYVVSRAVRLVIALMLTALVIAVWYALVRS